MLIYIFIFEGILECSNIKNDLCIIFSKYFLFNIRFIWFLKR